jgi:UDP-glucuronate decarboxylase
MSESKESGPINLGNPLEIDLLTLGNIVAKVLKVDAKFTYQAIPEDDPHQRRPDVTLARTQLQWNPTTDLDIGIIKTSDWIKKVLQR